jgi:hypothetical protein
VTIAKRRAPGQDVSACTAKQNFRKYEYFDGRRLTQQWGVLPVAQRMVARMGRS